MEFSEEERQKLTEFKGKMEALLPDEYTKTDLYLIRLLRARDLNLTAAEEMLKNHLKWREENKIEILLQGTPDSFYTKNYQYWLNGVDLRGQPGLWKRIIKEFEDYVNRMYERVLEAIRNANERRDAEKPPVTQFTLILNWEKFSVLQTANLKAIQTLVNIAATYEAHYPEILSQAYFLNTNQFFQIVFAMMKPILAPRTLSKITCFGTNRSEWEPIVRAAVDEHQIPRQFGG